MTSYDYIIVGAGSSGCVLADRLSRSGRNKVLVVESGPIGRNPLIQMPRGFGRTLTDQSLTWTYEAEKTGGYEQPEHWVRGRVLGGSSSVNGMIYARGQPADYDAWLEQGCTGWGWADIKPAFLAIEDHQLGGSDMRGVGGPLRLTVHPRGNALCEAMINAGREMGLPRVDDLNAAEGQAIGYHIRTISRGRRQSAAKAFLRPAVRRPNLEVRTGVDVLRVLFEGKRAVGIRVRAAHGEQDLHGAEIILSAGTLNSPKLLQLSGIGPPEQLRAAGVPVLLEAPDVGANMREHRLITAQFRVRSGSENRRFRGAGLAGSLMRYAMLRRGPLTAASFEVGGLVCAEPGASRPDAHLVMGPMSVDRAAAGVAIEREPGAMCGGYVMRPESRGWIRIVSPDPAAPARINPNYLATDYDRRVSVALMRYIRALYSQPALSPYVVREIEPGPDIRSDEAIVDAFHRTGLCGYHATSTCRMGADARAVVDTHLRVKGLERLRVCDLSVMPTLVSGNTNGPAMALAWRAADLIGA